MPYLPQNFDLVKAPRRFSAGFFPAPSARLAWQHDGLANVTLRTPVALRLSTRTIGIGGDVRPGHAGAEGRQVGGVDIAVGVKLGALAGRVVLRNAGSRQAGLHVAEVGQVQVAVEVEVALGRRAESQGERRSGRKDRHLGRIELARAVLGALAAGLLADDEAEVGGPAEDLFPDGRGDVEARRSVALGTAEREAVEGQGLLVYCGQGCFRGQRSTLRPGGSEGLLRSDRGHAAREIGE